MNIKSALRLVQDEISKTFELTLLEDPRAIAEVISNSKRIVTVGAGRVGLVMSAFAKRLGHLGYNTFYLSDTCLPKIGPGDTVIIGSGSGSGETRTIVLLGEISRTYGATVILITANSESTLSRISEHKIVLNCPHKGSDETKSSTLQPMTSLFEQVLYLYLDSFVIYLMQNQGITEEQMQARHNILE